MKFMRFHTRLFAFSTCRLFAGVAVLLMVAVLAQPLAFCQENVEFEYIYDDNNQLVRVIDSLGNVVTYNYDAAGNLVSVTQTTVDQLGPPEITNVTPASLNAGETVGIALVGNNFFLGEFSVDHLETTVLAKSLNDSAVTALLDVPLDASIGPVQLIVTTELGSDSITINVIGPLPKLTQVVPARGTALGGTAIVLFGSQLTPDTQVRFGGAVAPVTVFVDPSRIEVETPPGPAGQLVTVAVSNPNGATQLIGGYQYVFPFSLPGAHPLAIGATQPLVVTLGEPALADISVAVSVDNPSIAAAPSTLVIPAGQRTASIPVTGAGIGTTSLRATINGLTLSAAVFVGGLVAGDYDIAVASVGGLIPMSLN